MKGFLKERLPLKEIGNHLRKPLPKHINLLFSLGSLAMFSLVATSGDRRVSSTILLAIPRPRV